MKLKKLHEKIYHMELKPNEYVNKKLYTRLLVTDRSE